MFRVLEEFQWGILIQKVANGLVLRLRIISEWCKKIWTLNAHNWAEPPLKYIDMKRYVGQVELFKVLLKWCAGCGSSS